MKLSHFLGFHNPLVSVETGEIRFKYQNPFELFITKYSQYQCECGRQFWMPKGSFEEWRLAEQTYKMTLCVVKELEKQGRYNEAIDLLK